MRPVFLYRHSSSLLTAVMVLTSEVNHGGEQVAGTDLVIWGVNVWRVSEMRVLNLRTKSVEKNVSRKRGKKSSALQIDEVLMDPVLRYDRWAFVQCFNTETLIVNLINFWSETCRTETDR